MIGPEVAQTARDRSVMFCEDSVRWLYRLEENFSWESGLSISQDYAFKDKTGVVRLILESGGRITVTRDYAWNGCSPKFCFFDLLFGTPDGVVHAQTGKPKTYYASLVHDVLYQFVHDGLPLKQHDADRCFLPFSTSSLSGSSVVWCGGRGGILEKLQVPRSSFDKNVSFGPGHWASRLASQ